MAQRVKKFDGCRGGEKKRFQAKELK